MPQFPKQGASKKQTIISDYVIEFLSSSFSNSESSTFYFDKKHSSYPTVVLSSVQNSGSEHVNLFIKELAPFGTWATGSLTIAAGTSNADLNGDTFTLLDKDSSSQVFTFNDSDDVVTNGSIGLLSDTNIFGIVSSIKSAINNVTTIDISADTITQSISLDPTSTHTLELIQDITGSDGNTTIDASGVTGGSSQNFNYGTNYGSGSIESSDAFTGTVYLRVISQKNQYLL
jgi:hypothetical protein